MARALVGAGGLKKLCTILLFCTAEPPVLQSQALVRAQAP